MLEPYEICECVGGWALKFADLAAGVHASQEAAEMWGQFISELWEAKQQLDGIRLHRVCGDYENAHNDRVLAFELQLLANALNLANGNQTQAAKSLGLKRTTFIEKAGKYGLIGSK